MDGEMPPLLVDRSQLRVSPAGWMRRAFAHLLISFTSRTAHVIVSVIFRLSSAELWLKLRELRWSLWRSFTLCWLSASTDTGTTATSRSSFRWDVTPALLPIHTGRGGVSVTWTERGGGNDSPGVSPRDAASVCSQPGFQLVCRVKLSSVAPCDSLQSKQESVTCWAASSTANCSYRCSQTSCSATLADFLPPSDPK